MASKSAIEEQIKHQGDVVRKLKAAKESKERVQTEINYPEFIITQRICEFLNDYLISRSYLCEFTPTSADRILFKSLKNKTIANYVHVKRWYTHIESYTECEKAEFSECAHDKIVQIMAYLLDLQVNKVTENVANTYIK